MQQKREAAFRAPLGRELHRPDTTVVERPGWYQILTPSAVGYLNEIYISELDDRDAERVIDEVVAEHRAFRKRVKWCVGHWTRPTDFRERLVRRGFETVPVRVMACSAELAVGVPPAVSAVEVGMDGVDAYVDAVTKAWGMREDQLELERCSHRAALAATPRTAHFFTASIAGTSVATAGVFLRDGFGYLVGGQVLAEARGRGAYRGLVAARLAFLRARGITLAITHALEGSSAPMLEHLGFETLYRFDCMILAA
jgi:hypothetical protein